MKINDVQRLGALSAYNQNRNVSSTKKQAASRKDELSISQQAKQMQDSKSAAELKSTTEPQRLAQLQDSVQSGTYHVDTQKLVDAVYPYIR